MTKEKKLEAIKQRLELVMGESVSRLDATDLSLMMFISYMEFLEKKGLIMNGQMSPTDMGRFASSLSEEFEWELTDEEIETFSNTLVDQNQIESISHLVKMVRDDKEKVLELVKGL